MTLSELIIQLQELVEEHSDKLVHAGPYTDESHPIIYSEYDEEGNFILIMTDDCL